MKARKIILLFLIAMAFVACSNGKEATETSTETVATETAEATEPPVVIEKGKVDLAALKSEGKPILLQFGQDGCPPCEQMTPYVVKLQEEYADTVIIRYVDVHQNRKLTSDHQIRMTPSQIFIDREGRYIEPAGLSAMETAEMDDGTRIVHHVGILTEEVLREVLNGLAAE